MRVEIYYPMKTTDSKTISRNKFILWGTALLAGIGLIKYARPSQPQSSGKQKYLTQDGTLVEVDDRHVEEPGVKIMTPYIKDWVKRSK